jgi:NADH-quinone oxidoreductase subunit N
VTSMISGTQLWMLSPEISVTVLGLLVLVLDLFVKRRVLIAAVAIGGLIVPLIAVLTLAFGPVPNHGLAFFNMLVVDQYAIFFKLLFLLIGAVVGLAAFDYIVQYSRATVGEFYAILLFSVAGMMLMASSRELITIYISFELTSIPLYVLAGLSRRDDRSAEAAVKYVLLGAMSSAILLYGMALLYGATGSTDLGEIAFAVTHGLQSGNLLLLAADAFIFTGFGFKVSAVPFHMWAPDIYEGSPTPSTLFFTVGSKAAGFAALLRVFVAGGLVTASNSYLWVMVAVVAALTMTVGNVAALRQKNIKRMMAYSGIGQAGYILLGVAALMIHNTVAGNQAVLTFILVYVVTNLGAFAGIIALADSTGREQIRDFDGLWRRSPAVAAGLALCMLSLAGWPPTAGFLSKVFLFWTAWQAGSALPWLVILAVINSAVSMVYYANIVWRMFVADAPKQDRLATPSSVSTSLLIGSIGVLVLTPVFPWLLTQTLFSANSLFVFLHP